jgi:hypothetical protein
MLKVALVVSAAPGPCGSVTSNTRGVECFRTIFNVLGPASQQELEKAILELGSQNRTFRFIIIDVQEATVSENHDTGELYVQYRQPN